MRNSNFLRNQTQSIIGTWLLACAAALAAWGPLQQAAASDVTAETVLVGQAYGPDLVLLQSEEPAKGAAPKPPSNLTLAALHAAGAAQLPPAATVRWLAALPPVRPQRLAGKEKARYAECAYRPSVGVPVVDTQPATVPNRKLADWFDPGAPDHCQTDDGLSHYAGLVGLSAGMPVLAHTGFGELKADYGLAGSARPMSSAEKTSVRKYSALWKKDFKRIYRKPFKANDEGNPYGPIRTLADAEILLVLRDKMGNAILRVSFWDPMSPGLHLTRMLIVDHLDGSVVKRSWSFGRAQGVAG
jgi:hypothetical protein